MFAAAAMKRRRNELPAARLSAAVSNVVEPLESRVLFASGDLDVTFGGGDGVVTQNFFSRNDFGFSVAVQSDQKLVVAGWVTTGTTTGNDVAVMRYNPDGSLDTSFGGGDGIVTTHLGSTSDTAVSVAVQSDGKIVVGGQARGSTTLNDFAVVRYNADGSLDTSFGTGGIVKTDLNGGASDTAAAMTLMADGRIVLVGSTIANLESSFAAVRYTSDGQLDTSFGTNGVVIARYGNGPSSAKSVAAMADGSVVLGGTLSDLSAPDSDFAAIRLLSDGSLDTAFGAAGWARVNGGGETEVANAVVAMPDGRVMLAGQSLVAGHLHFAVVRLTTTGQADVAFGVNGFVHHGFAGGGDGTVLAAVMQSDGRLLVAGNALVDGMNRLALARYNLDGSLDSNFGAGGMASVAVGIDARGKGVALDATGRILVVGNAHNSANFDFVLARLENQVNASPVAHAGGPYTVLAGASVVLDGSGSTDLEGALVSYEWDMNYDGSSFDVDATGVAPSFSSSAAGMHTVALRVTDAEGAMHVVTTTVTVLLAPAAHAGGPYSVVTGGSLVLDGSASSDADGSLVSYEWDFNYDGSSFDVDASGMSPSFDSTGLSGMRTVALRVTDNDGLVHLVTTTLNVMVPPTANAGGPYTVTAGDALVLNGSASSDVDGSVVTYEWDFDYDGSSFNVDATGMNPNFPSAGLSGVRTVALRVTDNDGLVHVATTTVTVNVPPPRGPAFLVDDPNHPGKKMLVVSGSGRSERIRFTAGKNGVEVRIGRTSAGVFAGMTRIVVHGNGGNDIIDATNLALPVALFGGAGNDRLVGSKFGDILVGGEGDDTLDGGRGNDLIVGGTGRDALLSRSGNDMLVAGSLAVGDDLDSLTDVLSAWAQSAALSSKKTVAPAAGSMPMVVDDGVRDTLFGTPGADALHSGTGDRLVKLGR